MTRAALIACLACVLLTVPAAQAKDGVRATLDRPERLRDAAAGERLAVAWKLTDAAGQSFGADAINLRVRHAADGATRVVAARDGGGPGLYVADLTIPAGGLDSIAVGLEGMRMVPGRPPARADMIFPVVNDPLGAARGGEAARPSWGALAVILAMAGLVAAACAGLRNRAAGKGALSALSAHLDRRMR